VEKEAWNRPLSHAVTARMRWTGQRIPDSWPSPQSGRSPRQNPVQGFFGAGRQVGQALSLSGPLLPANDAAMLDRQQRTTATRRNTLALGGSITVRISSLVCSFDPLAAIGPRTPIRFFCRIASSTDRSARVAPSLEFHVEGFVASVLTGSGWRPGLAPSRWSAPSLTCWRMRARSVE